MSITIIGLGPGDPGMITRAAWECLQQANTLYLRTAVHPTVSALPTHLRLHSFDSLYDQATSFESIYISIAQTLITEAQKGADLLYAVPGDPNTAEASTAHIRRMAQEADIPVRILPGVSFLEPICTALGIDPLAQGLQLLDALDLIPVELDTQSEHAPSWASLHGYDYYANLSPFPLQASRPALICQVYNRRIASHVKLSLMERYPSEHPISLISAAGVPGQERVVHCVLHELDHQSADHLSSVFVPALTVLDDRRSADGLTYVVERLLGPDGCPWDREQSPQSMRAALLGELYEVLEALDNDDHDSLSEELGDLLMNIIFQAELARQAGSFNLGDVYEHVTTKLIRRHPHVFGELSVDGSGEVLRNWEAIKQAEHAAKGKQRKSALDGIPKALPALMLAQETLRKTKNRVETQYFASMHHGASVQASDASLEAQVGELLMSIVTLAATLNIDAETALRRATMRYANSFREWEQDRMVNDK